MLAVDLHLVFTQMSYRLAIVLALLGTAASQAQQSPEPEGYVIEDGGVSVQTSFWLSTAQPSLAPGKTATDGTTGSINVARKLQGAGGFMFSIPAGIGNTLRLSYDRVERSTAMTTPADLALFSVGYSAGDYLTTAYKMQHVKLSWDYLSYTWEPSKLRFKTLWELHYASSEVSVDAPFKEIATDSDGYPISNATWGRKWVVLPALGIELEQALSKRFRWEAKASGFGLPKRAALWDTEASAVLRLGKVELLCGARAFKVKTSPKDDAYFNQTLAGPFAGLRIYWGADR